MSNIYIEKAKLFFQITNITITFQEVKIMTNSKNKVVPEAREALDKFKYEVASEVGVNLKQGYNGDISAKDAGKIGGQMVRKLIQQAENNMKQFLRLMLCSSTYF